MKLYKENCVDCLKYRQSTTLGRINNMAIVITNGNHYSTYGRTA